MDTTTKTCSRCGSEYPATTEWFRRDRHKRDGLYPVCKPCYRVKTRKKRRITPISERLASNSSWKGECLEWNGLTGKDGYGNMTVLCDDGKWRPKRVHRLAYEQAYGTIPDGLIVCHSCDNPTCINPAHLWLGTHKQNTRDMVRKGRAKNQWHSR